MSNITYVHQDTTYDVTQLAPEGQKAFQLLVTAEQDVRRLEDSYTKSHRKHVVLRM